MPPFLRYSLIIMILACVEVEAKSSIEVFKPLFTTIKAEYASGYCEAIREDKGYPDLYRRFATLIAWDDLLGYSQGGKSLTQELVGNKNIAAAGQSLNPHFLGFVDYANRDDVAALVAKDREAIKAELKKIAESLSLDKDYMALQNKVAEIEKKGMMPMATLTQAEVEEQLAELTLSPVACTLYQIIMHEGSQSAIEFQHYANSVSKRSMHNNFRKLEDALHNLEQQ